MKAIAAHFRYISRCGRLVIEDQRGERMSGKACLRDLIEEWRLGGSYIDDSPDQGHRREAFNIMLSMPRGTDPICVQRAAREFCRQELDGHKFVMVLHDHQANPHVHISARAEASTGRRLNPRKADLQRWRETFAERLREYGIDAEATPRASRYPDRTYEALWRLKAKEGGRLRHALAPAWKDACDPLPMHQTTVAWDRLRSLLASSPVVMDRKLASDVETFLAGKVNERTRGPEPSMRLHMRER